MSETPFPFRSGDAVRVREQRWRVAAVSAPGRAHAIVTLNGAGSDNRGDTLTIVTPFDRVEPARSRGRLRLVGLPRWQRSWNALLDESARYETHTALRSAANASIDLLPHQLEPAIAILQGAGSRALIADEVGLGKTIEAGLIVSELRARGAADRVLVLAPAALCAQWAAELEFRFGLRAVVVDTREGRRRSTSLPPGVNPWITFPIAIASIEYVKRPEVLAAVSAVRWDVAIVDEAHGATAPSERRDAADAICRRAAYVLLLTATPHNGDTATFESLLRIGAIDQDEAPVIFRRTREDVALGVERRIHCVSIEPSPSERAMFDTLDALKRVVGQALSSHASADARLAVAVLEKRAISSAHSLADSAARRLSLLGERGDRVFDGEADAPVRQLAADSQLQLPLAPADEDEDLADAPPAFTLPLLDDRELERSLLRDTFDAAAAALPHQSKIRVLRTLLRRLAARHEAAIVFTEFRDTLLYVRASLEQPSIVIHGGMTPDERRAAVGAFTNGAANVLLATDAAGEGLNLQNTCRAIINVELPWNPVRLEQRIGRVDRIGQQRRVHVFHLILRGTYEKEVLSRLQHRLRAARADFVVADPLGLCANDERMPRQSGMRLVDEAQAEFRRLVEQRERRARAGGREVESTPGDEILALAVRHPCLRVALSGRSLAVCHASIENGSGARCAIGLVPLAMPPRGRTRAAVRTLLRHIESLDIAAFALIGWQSTVEAQHRTFWSRRLARERAIAAISENPPRLLQSGLFDRRADREREERCSSRARVDRECASRIFAAERAATLELVPPRPVLLLLA